MKSTPIYIIAILVLSASMATSKDEVIDSGKEITSVSSALPLPSGVGFWYFGQEQDYQITALSATAGGFPIPGFDESAITGVENRVDQFNFKCDHWVFPWLNIHGVLGTGSGEAFATVNPLLPIPLANFLVGYDAFVYGGGLTVAAGTGLFFVSLTADYTWGDVDFEQGAGLVLNNPSGIETLVLTPKLGVHGNRGAVWVGAYYQHTQHVQTGTINLPLFGPVNFAAEAEDATDWTPVVGGEFYFNEHWSLTAELGFGEDRHQGLVGITYRF